MTQNSPGGYVRTMDSAEADADALRLRSRGLTYRQIADALDVDTSTAWRRCQRALAAVPLDAVEEHRALELMRLDALQEALWDKAMDGSPQAVRAVLDVMARRSKLLGLDVPERTMIEHLSGEDIDAEVARLEKLLSDRGEL
jgi:orotate phosphoribosyltransferase-like protein